MINTKLSLQNSEELYTNRWRKTLLQALPFAIFAFLLGWLLEVPSQQATSLDMIGYPVMALFMVFLEVLLAFKASSLRFVLFSIVIGASSFFALKLFTVLFLDSPSAGIQAQLTETFYWVPVVYLISFVLPNTKTSRWIMVIFTELILVFSALHGIMHPFEGEHIGVVYSLIQMNLANTTLLALTIAFINFKDDYISAHARMETIEQHAYIDSLTGLPNRHWLQEHLEKTLKQAAQSRTRVAILFIDLDGFKLINDTLGHEAGDQLLQQVALRMRQNSRQNDFLARISGDEFLLVIHDDTLLHDGKHIAANLQSALVEPFKISNQFLTVSTSIGISVFPEDGADGATLLKHADSAMYRVKRSGKNGIEKFHGQTDSQFERQREIEKRLGDAINNNELSLAFQPLYDLNSGKVVKFEALVRWVTPDGKHISPDEFIPLAERSGLIVQLGAWVLTEACRQAKQWYCENMSPFKVSVNVSALQFAQPDFFKTIVNTLETTKLPPELLELELTESIVMYGLDHVSLALNKLKRLGVSIAIDDFGTGYSSLAYLRDLPIDTVKIDQSFIRDLGEPLENPQFALALIEAIVSLAEHLNLEVAAEGIETSNQRKIVKELGCHLAQGYYFAKPMPANEVGLMYNADDSNPAATSFVN